jgi:hypothetical protein
MDDLERMTEEGLSFGVKLLIPALLFFFSFLQKH